jgi:hypothetical protein
MIHFITRYYKQSFIFITELCKTVFFLKRLLLRKEVIHPHLPVGIPCYDFSPVINPILIGPLPYGLGYRLWILLTPMP